MEEDHKEQQEKALEKRLSGQLPTLDIAGKLFHIDLGMDCLRAKDKEIRFSDIKECYSWLMENYSFPYDPKKMEWAKIDVHDIESIPDDILLVEFPSKQVLDPVAYTRIHSYDMRHFVRNREVREHHVAMVKPFKAHLLEQQHLERQIKQDMEELKGPKPKRKRKGRSL